MTNKKTKACSSESKKKSIFYRRCHKCNSVTDNVEPVLQCHECGKVMAPFFYFDVRKTRAYTDSEQTALSFSKEGFRPIEGLTVYW